MCSATQRRGPRPRSSCLLTPRAAPSPGDGKRDGSELAAVRALVAHGTARRSGARGPRRVRRAAAPGLRDATERTPAVAQVGERGGRESAGPGTDGRRPAVADARARAVRPVSAVARRLPVSAVSRTGVDRSPARCPGSLPARRARGSVAGYLRRPYGRHRAAAGGGSGSGVAARTRGRWRPWHASGTDND